MKAKNEYHRRVSLGADAEEIFEAANDTIAVYKTYLSQKTDLNKLVGKIGLQLQEMAKSMPEINTEGLNLDGLNEALKANGVNVDLNGILGSILKPQGNSGEENK